jgi:TonB-dependent starch-binding outer membrane protein SusC
VTKYLLTLTGRYDGSSVLAEGNKWAFLPFGAAIAWRASEEEFVENLNLFSDLKLQFKLRGSRK